MFTIKKYRDGLQGLMSMLQMELDLNELLTKLIEDEQITFTIEEE